MTNKKNQIDLEEFKYLIDSRKLSSQDKRKERDAMLKAREERFKNRDENEIKTARLLQLKYQMEDYLNDLKCYMEPAFPKFLSSYIDILYEKRKNFAEDIDVPPITLSHIINQHREPKDSFIYRLCVHSEYSYKNICDYRIELWPKVYYQDKICHFLTSSKKWGKAEKKHVKGKSIRLAD